MKKNTKPAVYDYVDHVKFMNDMVDWFRKESKVFSFRYFAKKAGFASGSTLRFFLKNTRGLSEDSIKKVCKGFALDHLESKYFENIVNLNQSENHEEKNKHFEEMLKIQKRKKINMINSDQYEYFSKWYHPAIRELVRCKDFQGDPKWIAKRISPMISVIEARESLLLLTRLGLIQKNSKNQYVLSDRAITTEREVRSIFFRNFHDQMCDRAKEALEISLDRRDFSGITFGIPASKIHELKDRIAEFRKQLTSSVGSLEDETDEVYHMNIQLFPLTNKEKKWSVK